MRKPRIGECIFPAETPGPVGFNDQADPNVLSMPGETPGPLGFRDYAECLAFAPPLSIPVEFPEHTEAPFSGAVAVGVGAAATVRIPVPGSGGLYIEFTPRGRLPEREVLKRKGLRREKVLVKEKVSTSTLFIQDFEGKRHLRLDLGPIEKNGKSIYHWDQKGVHEIFDIQRHTPAGRSGQVLYEGARYFRYGGRTLGVVGITVDIYSIVVARRRMRRITQVAGGWGGAVGGCKAIGAVGAAIGSHVQLGAGTAVGGVVGCIGGGLGGYYGAEWAAGALYDWVEETYFEYLPEIDAPPER